MTNKKSFFSFLRKDKEKASQKLDQTSDIALLEREESTENHGLTQTNSKDLIKKITTNTNIALESQQEKKQSFFQKLSTKLTKTKTTLGFGLKSIFAAHKIDDELFDEIQMQLLKADVGLVTTNFVIEKLKIRAKKQGLTDANKLYPVLKNELVNLLEKNQKPLTLNKSPFVLLMVGVNGVGKTTSLGKLAKKFQKQGKSVALAAGDTFRAGAIAQLEIWAKKNEIAFIAQKPGSDSASVIFDALTKAKSRGYDVLLADTAGRLQTKVSLMNELEKITRVLKKQDETAPHEIMITLDATIGQNAISQVELFKKAVKLSGIVLTKLDGSAKGGIIFSLAHLYNIPIRYIGVGEKEDDLNEFNAKEFVEALFDEK